MKKIISLALATLITATLFAACGSGGTSGSSESVKTGFATVLTAAKSTPFADGKPGQAEADCTLVAITLDKDGKIANCAIDGVQAKINFDEAGMLQTPLDTVVKSKMELGDEYGLKKASGIGKEWNEQAAAFAKYVVGKTIAEVKGIAVNEKGAPTATDLTSSVTIGVGEFISALEKAVNTAKDAGARRGDKLGLGAVTNIAKSTDATAEKEGLAQSYSSYAAVTFDNDDKVTGGIFDGSQVNVSFDKAGQLVGDVKLLQKSKNELGEAYGMKKASSIGKEWNEQAAAFAKYVVGKTTTEVKGIAVNENGAPTSSDITSSVTIGVGDLIAALEMADKQKK